MKSYRTKLSKVTWFSKITGAAPDLLENCSAPCAKTFSFAGMVLMFTAVISGATIGYAISIFALKNPLLYPAVFLVWTIFIYFFDRAVILSNNPVAVITRTAGIIILALLNSFVLDTIILADEIEADIKRDYIITLAEVNEVYDDKIIPIQNKIDSILNDNRTYGRGKLSYIDSLQAEGRGLGGSNRYGIGSVYKNLEHLKTEYKTIAEENIKANNSIIASYKNEIAAINMSRNKAITDLVAPSEAGWQDRVHKMHEIIFMKGNVSDIIFFSILFCVFCFFESLPLQLKFSFKKQFKEYFDKQDAEHENHGKAIEARKISNWTIMQSEIQLDTQSSLARVASDSMLKKIELDLEDIRYRLTILEEFLREIENTELRLRNTFPQLYSEYINPEISKARKSLIKSLSLNT